MSSTTIAAQVQEMQEGMAGQEVPEPMQAFGREQRALARAPVPEGVAEVGSVVADVDLLHPLGETTTLYDALGDGPAVVVLYRGAWCPYCNLALNTYQASLLPALTERGVTLVAISPQSPDGSLSMKEKHDLAFGVLSDPGQQVANALGVVTAPGEEVRAAQLELGLDLTEVNADGTTAIAMPTAVLLDADRTIRWIDVHPDYSTRSEPADILAAVDAAGA